MLWICLITIVVACSRWKIFVFKSPCDIPIDINSKGNIIELQLDWFLLDRTNCYFNNLNKCTDISYSIYNSESSSIDVIGNFFSLLIYWEWLFINVT